MLLSVSCSTNELLMNTDVGPRSHKRKIVM